MSKEDMLRNAVNKLTDPLHLSSKTEVIDYYKDIHGAKGWTRAIAEDLYGSIKNKKGENVSVRNIQRRFQGERTDKGEGRSSQIYQQLGKKLPEIGRKLKGDSITVTIQGTQPGKGHKGTRNRVIEITLTGANAKDFINDPGYDALWDEYGVDLGDDSDYAVEIYSVG